LEELGSSAAVGEYGTRSVINLQRRRCTAATEAEPEVAVSIPARLEAHGLADPRTDRSGVTVQHCADPSTAASIGEWIIFGMVAGPPLAAALVLLAVAVLDRE